MLDKRQRAACCGCMADSTPINPADEGFEVRTFFVRSRNALLARADFSALYVDYYLHLSEQKIRYTPEQDSLFKKALSIFVLHCAERPWNEMTAWTLHFEELAVNIFLTADNETGAVTGRLFDENVKAMGSGMFYADVVRGKEPLRRSVAAFTGSDPLQAMERFYQQSEQREVKVFELEDERFALLCEHPDLDKDWFGKITQEQMQTLDTQETVADLEKRVYRWHCGCNQGRMLQVLAPVFRQDPEGIFGSEEKIEMRCPRCGSRHAITKEAMEAYIANSGKPTPATGS